MRESACRQSGPPPEPLALDRGKDLVRVGPVDVVVSLADIRFDIDRRRFRGDGRADEAGGPDTEQAEEFEEVHSIRIYRSATTRRSSSCRF